jgi:hypothetical protein
MYRLLCFTYHLSLHFSSMMVLDVANCKLGSTKLGGF